MVDPVSHDHVPRRPPEVDAPPIVGGEVIVGDVAVTGLDQRDAVLSTPGSHARYAGAGRAPEKDGASVSLEGLRMHQIEQV
jgi:hypothetical protein